MKGNYCVLFALGDVLADTGAHYKAIWKQIGNKYGAETENLLDVVKEKDIQKILMKYFSHLTQEEKDSLANELNERESKMKVREIYGASRFVKELKDEGVKMGLVTGFTKEQVDSLAEHLDFLKLMDTVVTREDVDSLKPDPQGYLQAANNLGYNPADCFVFEDSLSGIEAAKVAGMNIIALSTTSNPQQLRNIAPTIIPDFSNFSVADLNTLYKNKGVVIKRKKKTSPWVYIFLLVLILLGLFLLWRNCNTTRTDVPNNNVQTRSAQIVAPQDRTTVEEANVVTTDIESERVNLTLADGSSMNAARNGMEDRIISFLNSDEYKNATDDNLKNRWFDFDNIKFVHGSSSDLTEDSFNQLDNFARILKQYDNVKIKVGGYADKTGTDPVNEKISQQRANNVKSYLVNKGVPSANIITEGFSDEFAQYSASAPDAQRAQDRTVAIRFVK